ncbi:hypothetical protein DITRI_Ditri09bG0063100 [Diplodiscus trichospermus]
MILRDDSGNFIACNMVLIDGLLPPKEAESVGLLEAIKWVQSLQWKNVIFELDAKLVVDAIHSNTANRSELVP